MSKIILNKKSPSDTISSTDLNSDLNQFGSTNFSISSDNIREQSLDFMNFDRGVLSHPSSYVSASGKTGITYNENKSYEAGIAYDETRTLGSFLFGNPNLGQKIDLDLYEYIYRLSFQGIFWFAQTTGSERLAALNDFNGGLRAVLKVQYQVNVGGVQYTDDIPHLERGLVYIHGGTQLENLGHARFNCTIADKIDEDWFSSQAPINVPYDFIVITPRVEFTLLQFVDSPKNIMFRIRQKPLQYIQKFRK
jgi:hypothetical protein